jgi:multicomponent Na+:H+ antiporter subunit B
MITPILVLDILLLLLVAATAIAVVRARSLLSATILAGIYSLLMAMVWTNMHALDVAFTEASVGAGISTILLLGALVLTKRAVKPEPRVNWRALSVCLGTGALLVYGTLDMPAFGDPDAPIHTLRVPKLMQQNVGKHETAAPRDKGHAHEGAPDDDFNGHVPNSVTSLLAAYRGYDTMYETTVIFVAGLSLVLLLRRRKEGEPGVPISGPDKRAPAQPVEPVESSGQARGVSP